MRDTPLDRVIARVNRALPEILRDVEREIADAAALDRLMTLAAEQRLLDNIDALGHACSALED